jgi:hypothetical protein
MKSVLVIGGDKLGNITKKLEYEGFKEVVHLSKEISITLSKVGKLISKFKKPSMVKIIRMKL